MNHASVSTFHMLAAYSHLHADPDMVSKQQRLRLTPLSSLADEALAVYQTHRLPVRCEKPSSIYSLSDIEMGFCVSVCVCVAGRCTVPESNAKARDRCSPAGQTVKHSIIHICGDPSAYHFYRQYSVFELSFTGNQDGPYRPNFERSLLFHTNHKKMTSLSPDDSRVTRLSALFNKVLYGPRMLSTPRDGKLFIEAMCPR
jgi:hypothetical protein